VDSALWLLNRGLDSLVREDRRHDPNFVVVISTSPWMGAAMDPCGPANLEVSCKTCTACGPQKEERHLALVAGLAALSARATESEIGAPSALRLPAVQRRLVETAIERWCRDLSTNEGCWLDVGGVARRVRLAARPLALVVEAQGSFPLSLMDRVEPSRNFWGAEVCTILFSAGGCTVDGAFSLGPQTLRFSFPGHDECFEFALAMRALKWFAWEFQDALYAPTACDGQSTGGSSARSAWSQGSSATGGSRRKGNKKRPSTFHRQPRAKTGTVIAVPALQLPNASTLLSRAELQDLVDGQEGPPTPLDSPSGRTMKPSLLSLMTTHSPHPPTSDVAPAPPDSPSARRMRTSVLTVASPLRQRKLGSVRPEGEADVRESHGAKVAESRAFDSATTVPPAGRGTPNASKPPLIDGERDRNALGGGIPKCPNGGDLFKRGDSTPSMPHKRGDTSPSMPPKRGDSTPSMPLTRADSTSAMALMRGDSAPSAADEHSDEWRRVHQFRRARLAALLGPCP